MAEPLMSAGSRARGLILGLTLAAACARGPVVVEEAPEPIVWPPRPRMRRQVAPRARMGCYALPLVDPRGY